MANHIDHANSTPQSAFTIAATLAQHIEHEHPPHRRPVVRDAHPKHHGCVKAEFVVEPDIPAALRHGIFVRPGERFDAWVRFSNALRVNHDLLKDARGMAVKLLGVPGPKLARGEEDAETLDFLMVTHSAFFARTADDFVDFPAAVMGTPSTAKMFARIFRFFVGLRPPRLRWRGLCALMRSTKWASSPLVLEYFSQTPYSLGPLQVKFSAMPRQHTSLWDGLWFTLKVVVFNLRTALGGSCPAWENTLRDALLRHLVAHDASFDFCVQTRSAAPERMPLDDAVVPWSTRRAPFVKVASIRILKQSPEQKSSRLTATGAAASEGASIDEMMAFAQHLSFNPWHTIEEQRPLGSINEARRVVYERISTLRHGLNGVRRREPRTHETPAEYLRAIQHDCADVMACALAGRLWDRT